MTTNDNELALRRRLARHRAVATGLLVVTAAGAVGGAFLPHGTLPGLFRAACRAGFIGGLADWFAVTALFRRPLGLPIPHTAVIPRQKARLGRALGQFVVDHVFTEAELLRLIGRLDLPGLVGGLLADAELRGRLAARVAGAMPAVLGSVSDGSAGRLFGTLVPTLFEGRELGLAIARALRGLVAGQRHQAMVGFVVTQLRQALNLKEAQLRSMIEERVREQGGRLVGWALGGSIATRVLAAMNNELEGLNPAAPEISEAVDQWLTSQIAAFENEPGRAEELGRGVREMVSNEAVSAWSGDVWARLRGALEHDSLRGDGHLARLADEVLTRVGHRLQTDAAFRSRVDAMMVNAVIRALPATRVRLVDFIATVVAGWDDRAVVDKLELRVGRDLQYIRINGTVVGFLAGAAVFALLGN